MKIDMQALEQVNPKLAAMLNEMQAADQLRMDQCSLEIFNSYQERQLASGQRVDGMHAYSGRSGDRAAAPTGWIAPNQGIANWLVDWLHGADRWSSPRTLLASQLAYLRKAHGTKCARGFLNAVWRMGEHPARQSP